MRMKTNPTTADDWQALADRLAYLEVRHRFLAADVRHFNALLCSR